MSNIKDNQNTVCECGATFPIPPANGGARGYALLPDGRRICYACADTREIEELKDRSKPFVGYLALVSKDSWLGYQVTTWTGGKLMQVTRARSCDLTRKSFTPDKGSYMSIHAVDVHGEHWAGRGSTGMAIKMHPVGAK